MIIGITGNFGGGKSTTAEMFKEYGFEVIDVDKLYHDKIYKDNGFQRKIRRQFGTVNKHELKSAIFSDPKKIKELNKIAHPLIIKEIKKSITWINKKNDNKKDIIIDAPLLLETKLKNIVDKIIVVKTNKKNCIERLLKRKRYPLEDINKITQSQMSLKKKLEFADFVIDNNMSLLNTRKQVKKVVHRIRYNDKNKA